MSNPTLVTGAAGFIGYHVARRLLDDGATVVGADNLDPYYDPKLKRARLAELVRYPAFRFVEIDLANSAIVPGFFAEYRFAFVLHLAAQAGVRNSLIDPHAYLHSNILAFLNVLEGCRQTGCQHL